MAALDNSDAKKSPKSKGSTSAATARRFSSGRLVQLDSWRNVRAVLGTRLKVVLQRAQLTHWRCPQ